MTTVSDAIQQHNVAGQYGATFAQGLGFVLCHENEYLRGHWGDVDFIRTENVPGDGGRLTKWGLDQASHPSLDIANLTFTQAVAIYHQEWMAHDLDKLSEKLAIAAFDVWINGGHASLWLQQAYNKIHPESAIDEDGILGPHTLLALASADQDRIIFNFIQERNARFELLANKYPQDRQFLAGWKQRDTDLAKYLTA